LALIWTREADYSTKRPLFQLVVLNGLIS